MGGKCTCRSGLLRAISLQSSYNDVLPLPFLFLLNIRFAETMITEVVINSNKTTNAPPTPPEHNIIINMHDTKNYVRKRALKRFLLIFIASWYVEYMANPICCISCKLFTVYSYIFSVCMSFSGRRDKVKISQHHWTWGFTTDSYTYINQ